MELPYLPRRTPSFAFIVHPRSESDISRAKCLSLLRSISASDADFVMRVRSLPPTIVGEVLFGFAPFRGEIISIACLPGEVMSVRGRNEILRAAQIALDRGAKVIGLGALTAPATGGGSLLVEQLPSGVTITNGNCYTAAVLRWNVLEAIRILALERPTRIAIVGCTGSVGRVVSRLLIDAGFQNLILIGRTAEKAKRLLGALAPLATFSESVADVAPAARLTPEVIRIGAIVIDAAEPANVSDEDASAWNSHALIARGGRVRIPEYQCTYDFGLEDSTETFA